jgi:cell pole-organizing protein PopZ
MSLPPTPAPSAEPAGDPSMDDILASIRRILSDEEKAAAAKASTEPSDGVLVLDSSMMVAESADPEPEPEPPPSEPEPQPQQAFFAPEPPAPEPPPAEPAPSAPPPPAPAPPVTVIGPARDTGPLVAPEAAAAAASSVGTLMRTIASERSALVHRGGPTIEDLVREEMRPLLKEWLDTHLPPLVERLVRAEIERVVGRTTA